LEKAEISVSAPGVEEWQHF